MGNFFRPPKPPAPDPSIARNQERERLRLRAERRDTQRGISARRRLRRGGGLRMLLSTYHGGVADELMGKDLSSTLGSGSNTNT